MPDLPTDTGKKTALVLVPLDIEPRYALPTAEAALHLGFLEQTLRKWACTGHGPIKPVRLGGRLRWPVAELLRVLAGKA